MFFIPSRHLAACLLFGAKATAGTLYFTSDFLSPASSLPGSVAGSTDVGKFWYLATLRRNDPGSGFAEYPLGQYDPAKEKDTKHGKRDRLYAAEILRRCHGHRRTLNLFLNRETLERIGDWCTVKNPLLDEEMTEILRWEYTNLCRIVWTTTPESLDALVMSGDNKTKVDGWFLPHILRRIHRENDSETLGRIRRLYPFWKSNIETTSNCTNEGLEYVPVNWDSTNKT